MQPNPLILIISCVAVCQGSASTWTYDGTDNGPDKWGTINANCDKNRQSPIDIDTKSVVYDGELGDFIFSGYDDAGVTTELLNNGHAAKVVLGGNNATITSTGLNGTYKALQFHFHWGADDFHGSEHLIDHRAHPLEAHIVHYKEEYGTVDAALGQGDGIAVLGIMFQISKEDNADLNSLFDKLVDIEYKDEKATFTGFLLKYLLPKDTSKYYRYLGSLTTPDCEEAVVWTVFKYPINISNKQLTALRVLWQDAQTDNKRHHISGNYRPVQNMTDRTVYSSFKKEKPHWGYAEGETSPMHWEKAFTQCSGEKQSPINIVTDQVAYSDTLGDFRFEKWNEHQSLKMKLKNNGHTLQVDLADHDYVTNGAGLDGNYKPAQFHFHWGSEDWKGSEHTVNGQSYPMEIHIVHYSEKFASLSEAADKPKGLAVLGIFFHISENDNSLYEPLIQNLNKASFKGNESEIPTIQLTKLLPEVMRYYYRYDGSLTTPGCYESVIWSVFHDTIPISRRQLQVFRKVYETEKTDEAAPGSGAGGEKSEKSMHYIVDNFRPTQHKYGRKVWTNKKDLSATCGSEQTSASTIIALISSFIVIVWYQ